MAIHVAGNAKQFDCKKCTHHHCDETRAIPGSNGPAPFEKWEIPGVIKSRTCLLPMITMQTQTLLQLHKHYRQHHLPMAGGLLEQPNIFLQAMEIINGQ